MRIEVKFSRVRPASALPAPSPATDAAAGCDLRADIAADLSLEPGAYLRVPTGVALSLPRGYEAQVRPRSGLAARHGLTLLNAPGTIDADYRGEIEVILINHGREPFRIERGMRIAQLVVAPVAEASWTEVDVLDETERGSGGFGSTGL